MTSKKRGDLGVSVIDGTAVFFFSLMDAFFFSSFISTNTLVRSLHFEFFFYLLVDLPSFFLQGTGTAFQLYRWGVESFLITAKFGVRLLCAELKKIEFSATKLGVRLLCECADYASKYGMCRLVKDSNEN